MTDKHNITEHLPNLPIKTVRVLAGLSLDEAIEQTRGQAESEFDFEVRH